MKRIILATLLFLGTAGVLTAQRATISATLLDISNDDPIAGAVVSLRSQADTTQVKYYTSVYGGVVNIPDVNYGDYTISFTFLGYKEESKKIKVDRPSVNLGKVYLSESATMIDAVVAQGQAIRTSQKGDTVIYNADAYKVSKDADTEALLSKMPGITVIDGEVEAQGETVNKVFLDGKEFFGRDVTTAIKTLPAEMVAQIEVYNKLSDMAEFSGVDDGEGFKAINIVTRPDRRRGQVGKFYGTWGITDKYDLGGNVNFFGPHRFSINAMANNVNKQNFSIEDILGAVSGTSGGMTSRRGNTRFSRSGSGGYSGAQRDGVSQVQAFMLNYGGNWAKNLTAEGTYRFNNYRNKVWSNADREYTNQYRWMDTIYNSTLTKNHEHTFNLRLEYKINDNHQLLMRPSASFQRNRSESFNSTDRYDIDENTGLYEHYYLHDVSGLSKNWGYNIGNTLTYRLRLGKPGRTLITDLGGNYSKNDRESSNNNITTYDSDGKNIIVRDTTLNYSKNYNLNGKLMYTEPITQYSQLTMEYNIRYRYSDTDRQRYNWDEAIGLYEDVFDPEYSNIFNSGYLTQSVGPGYNIRKEETSLTVNAQYQRSDLKSKQEFPAREDMDYKFDNVVYFSRLEHSFNSENTLRIFARSSTSNPSISQLQNVVDISNTQSVRAGNPDLKQSYSHNLSAEFRRSIIEKGSTFMVAGRYNITNNSINDNITYSDGTNVFLPDGTPIQAGGEYRTYSNMSGNWNTSLITSYGFPITSLRLNINFVLSGELRQTPSILNNLKNKLFSQSYRGDLVVSSNMSENLDFTVAYGGGYNSGKNSLTNNNESITHNASLRFKWVMWADFTFSSNGSLSVYKGITQDYNDKNYMLNLAFGKKVFRNRRGEVTFGINDVFNQKTVFSRTVTNNYIQNRTYNTVGRYYAVQFIYNLRNFAGGGGGSRGGNPEMLRGPGGRPMGGPPPGGGPGGGPGGF